ncbi:ketosteroid isomerase [Spongiactinospora gelatinilytica]|uniref:Ketosteroid isomerase n=1 Tax=Spongiactinospora gelatinilytica TaxID=2666298 RepID=A0A2W2FIN6_9ACTN|nr:nuclear transport factor 2 family protein [Spongiactinospora gelatinilytica]PZG25200.1 ketosteroid isomerase [Spongiactinospora gelatinilytica]
MSHSIVYNAFSALAGNDPERISALFTEDAEWLSPPGNATAVALKATDHMVGRAAIVRFFSEDFPRLYARDVVVTLHEIHAAGERVVLEATMTATLPDGGHYADDHCFVLELRGEPIHRVREYADTARGFRAIFGEPARWPAPAGS